MNLFGDAVRQPIEAQKASGLQLTESIGITPTSVSHILNGVTRPRQNTFTRMCQALCKTKEEERRFVAAFTGTEFLEEEPDQPLPSAEKEILRLRAEQFLERKTQSIQFKRSVARELEKAGIDYQQDFCEGIFSTDFLIKKDGKRIALECKANVERDMEKTLALADLLIQQLGCRVYLVAPYVSGLQGVDFKSGVKLFPLSELLLNLIK